MRGVGGDNLTSNVFPFRKVNKKHLTRIVLLQIQNTTNNEKALLVKQREN